MNLPSKRDVAVHALQVAIGYLGVSRATDRDQVTRFLNLFGLPFADPQGKPYAFCDAGVGYATVKAYCDLIGLAYTAANAPQVFRRMLSVVSAFYMNLSASTHETRAAAIRRGVWLDKAHAKASDIQPGWWVLYSWPDDGEPDHIEIVEMASSDTLHTVAFNTSDVSFRDGGAVARKERPWAHVLGFVRTY